MYTFMLKILQISCGDKHNTPSVLLICHIEHWSLLGQTCPTFPQKLDANILFDDQTDEREFCLFDSQINIL